jgi:hypothetical protein
MTSYASEHDAIKKVMEHYIEGCRAGDSAVARRGFHANATIVGHYPGGTMTGSIEQVYGWIDGNGPAPGIEPRFADVQVVESIALVRLEVENWTGKLVGSTPVRMSDWFTLLKMDGTWTITHKTFHWHST